MKLKKPVKLDTIEAKMRRGAESQAGMQAVAVIGTIAPISAAMGFAAKGGAWWHFGIAGALTVGVLYAAYEFWRESKRIKELYAERLASLEDEPYHVFSFASQDEAAAFISALGPHLPKPVHDLASYEEDIEIAATSSNTGATVYLSDGAVQAVPAAFPSPPAAQQVQGRALPWNRRPILVGTPDEPITTGDVVLRLNGKEPPKPGHRSLRLSSSASLD